MDFKIKLFLSFVAFFFMCFCSIVGAQQYLIGKGDVLSITFWQQPELNTKVKVNQNGEINLPLIGNMKVEGVTIGQLSQKIVDEISIYNKNITQARVEVVQFESNKIYITGHVLAPGKYTFEIIPNLWKVILEAGGPAETALLSQVRIVRGEIGRNAGAKNIVVDLTKTLEKGDFSELPRLYPGDSVFVPGATIGGPGTTAGEAEVPAGVPQLGINKLFILGEVNAPGVYPAENGIPILQALAMAGGPTPAANLKGVVIISQNQEYPVTVKMDLERYSTTSELASILLQPGDSIYIPQKKASFFTGPEGIIFREFFRVFAASAASVILFFVLR